MEKPLVVLHLLLSLSLSSDQKEASLMLYQALVIIYNTLIELVNSSVKYIFSRIAETLKIWRKKGGTSFSKVVIKSLSSILAESPLQILKLGFQRYSEKPLAILQSSSLTDYNLVFFLPFVTFVLKELTLIIKRIQPDLSISINIFKALN